MTGWRKIVLGFGFLASGTFLTYVEIIGAHTANQQPNLLGLATVIGALAGGVLSIVWGNVQEHKAGNGGTK